MKYFLSALYGIIQGLTEFLPVSSSGHLSAFQNIFGKIDDSMSSVSYTLLLHVGTLAAVLLVYYKDVWNLIKSFFSLVSKLCTGRFKYKTFSDDEKFFCMLFVALIPLLLGAVLEGTVEFLSSYTLAIGILWILNSFILLVSEKIKKETINFILSDNIIENLLNTNSYKMYDMLIHKAVTQTTLITTSFLQKVKSVRHANMINIIHGIHNRPSHFKHICNNLFIYLQISKISSTNTFSPFSIFRLIASSNLCSSFSHIGHVPVMQSSANEQTLLSTFKPFRSPIFILIC